MLHSGKCPHCQRVLGYVKAEAIEIRASTKDKYKGISYSCPSCHSVLSVSMDPLALNQNILNRLPTALGKG